MKIRSVLSGAVFTLVVGVAPLASASSWSLNHFKSHVLPVLVTVNSQGVVTDVSPAYPLRKPSMRRQLKAALEEMITGPATSHGKAVASQSVITLALQATPQANGKYQVKFQYVGAVPVPYNGSWFWQHIDGHRLALTNQGMLNMRNQANGDRRARHDHARNRARAQAEGVRQSIQRQQREMSQSRTQNTKQQQHTSKSGK